MTTLAGQFFIAAEIWQNDSNADFIARFKSQFAKYLGS